MSNNKMGLDADVDMANMTSRDLGNLMSKTLIERGKEVAKQQNPNVDYADLPSDALTDMGKQAIDNETSK